VSLDGAGYRVASTSVTRQPLPVTSLVWQHASGRAVYGMAPPGGDVLFDGATTWRIVGGATLDPAVGQSQPIWQSIAGGVSTSSQVLYEGLSDWRVAAAIDLDGDTYPDLIWQSPTGSVAVWYLRAGVFRSAAMIYSGASDWKVVGAGRLDG